MTYSANTEQRMDTEVIDNEAEHRFELPIGDLFAAAYYKMDGGRIVFLHTEVPNEVSGKGYGSKLAHAAFESVKEHGLRVIAKCPFMAAYASRHPEYAALLDG